MGASPPQARLLLLLLPQLRVHELLRELGSHLLIEVQTEEGISQKSNSIHKNERVEGKVT